MSSPSQMRPLKRILSMPAVQLLLIPLLATVLTILTGLVLVYRVDFADVWQYGLPLVWRTQINPWCGVVPLGVPLRFCADSAVYLYRWDIFALDLALFMGLGYSFILWSRRRWSLFVSSIVPLSAALLTCATAYLVSMPTPPHACPNGFVCRVSVTASPPAWTNGFPIPFAGVYSYEWVFNWIWFTLDTALFAAVEYLAVFLYRGFSLRRVPSSPQFRAFRSLRARRADRGP